MRFLRKLIYLGLGGGAYVLLELLWRGRSHISMFLLGGGCFLMLGKIRQLPLTMPYKMLLGATGITAGELVTGLLFNRDHSIWDYSQIPFNFQGQICLPFSLLWIPLSALGILFYSMLEDHFSSAG